MISFEKEDDTESAFIQHIRLKKASWPMGRLVRANAEKPESISVEHWQKLVAESWLDEAQNLVVFGADTSDRTYVAESLAKNWFLGGRRVLLASFPQIVNRLTESKERGTFNRTIKLLDRYEVIVIDELIRWNHRVEERMALFAELLAHRAGRRSVVITSGLPFYLWQVNERIERFVEGSIFTELKRTCQANQIRSRRK